MFYAIGAYFKPNLVEDAAVLLPLWVLGVAGIAALWEWQVEIDDLSDLDDEA